MHDGVITCARHTLLSDVARLMANKRLHCLVVADDLEATSIWGVISDLDLVAAASVRDLDEQRAEATSATPVVTVNPDETLQRAAQLMTTYATAHLIVTDETTTRPIGVLSSLDIAAALGSRKSLDD